MSCHCGGDVCGRASVCVGVGVGAVFMFPCRLFLMVVCVCRDGVAVLCQCVLRQTSIDSAMVIAVCSCMASWRRTTASMAHHWRRGGDERELEQVGWEQSGEVDEERDRERKVQCHFDHPRFHPLLHRHAGDHRCDGN